MTIASTTVSVSDVAAVLQAVAAVASLGVTWLLYRATHKYVDYTRVMVDEAAAQGKLARATVERDAAARAARERQAWFRYAEALFPVAENIVGTQRSLNGAQGSVSTPPIVSQEQWGRITAATAPLNLDGEAVAMKARLTEANAFAPISRASGDEMPLQRLRNLQAALWPRFGMQPDEVLPAEQEFIQRFVAFRSEPPDPAA